VRLAVWRKKMGKTQAWLADELGCSQSYISQIERVEHPYVPGVAMMIEIYLLSHGQVQPNDFYVLPDLRTLRKVA
jgi:transcriptional regulator with XRE-family HTH domain